MYAKHGAILKQGKFLNMPKRRDVRAWTALIAGKTGKGECQEALKLYEVMKLEGLLPDAVTFSCILKACGLMRAAEKGAKVHDEIVRRGLLGNGIFLGTSLIDMYVKCGSLEKAQKVLDELCMRDVVSWSALIAGYAQQGQGKKALDYYERMLHEGLSPNAVTLACILKACGNIGAADTGEKVHDDIVSRGLLKNDIVLGTALVDMYVKCGALEKAQQVLNELPSRNVVSWSALIRGFTQQGQGQGALECYEQMQREGLSPNAVTFALILKACGSLGAADKGRKIHDEIARQGLLGNDVVLGTALVDMYVKCGSLNKARQVLNELPRRNVVSWSALIGGYAQQGQGKQALDCYQKMKCEGISPNTVTYVSVLKASGIVGSAEKGEKIHDEIMRQGLLGKNSVLGNALVDMYAKCGALAKAQEVLEKLPVRDVVSWNALIAGCMQQSQNDLALRCFEKMQFEGLSPNAMTYASILNIYGSMGADDKGEKLHDEIIRQGLLANDIVLGNAVVDMYAKCGCLSKAQLVHYELPHRNQVSWSALIAGYVQWGHGEQALNCFERMKQDGFPPNEIIFSCALKACGCIRALNKGREIHDEIVRQSFLGTNLVIGSALVDMYVKCGRLMEAQQVFEVLPVREEVSWSALIAGYAQHGQGKRALKCLKQMEHDGLFPDAVTLASILKACGSIGAIDNGQEIHDEIIRRGLLGDGTVLGNVLIDMYAKCGALLKAQQVLEELPTHNVASWSPLIAGYAQQGQVEQALHCFKRMRCEGLSPDAAVFSCVLSACSMAGLAEDAQTYLSIMSSKYGLKPTMEHYTCLIDLFGRVGHLDKALDMIEKMPSFHHSARSALLGACMKWGSVSVGKWGYEQEVQGG